MRRPASPVGGIGLAAPVTRGGAAGGSLSRAGLNRAANQHPRAGTPVRATPGLGYVSGVFDLFHIGHLNIIMRARRQCERLVVGVVTDEVVRQVKGRPPVVPLAERLALLRGLRDVDGVIVDQHRNKFDTWRYQLPYQVLFKGDDWQGSERADRLAADLEPVGARIEYFPYTSQTSSSLLREVLTQLARAPVALSPRPDGQDACPTCGGPF